MRINQYHDRQWCSSTRQTLIPYDIWALAYDVLQQRTGQTLSSRQYGHNQCLFNVMATTTRPLLLKPCVLRRPGEPLAPSGSHNVQPKRNAQGVPGVAVTRQPVLAPQQPCVLRRLRQPLALSGVHSVQPKISGAEVHVAASAHVPVSVPQQDQSMHPHDGRERDQ